MSRYIESFVWPSVTLGASPTGLIQAKRMLIRASLLHTCRTSVLVGLKSRFPAPASSTTAYLDTICKHSQAPSMSHFLLQCSWSAPFATIVPAGNAKDTHYISERTGRAREARRRVGCDQRYGLGCDWIRSQTSWRCWNYHGVPWSGCFRRQEIPFLQYFYPVSWDMQISQHETLMDTLTILLMPTWRHQRPGRPRSTLTVPPRGEPAGGDVTRDTGWAEFERLAACSEHKLSLP